MRTSYCGITTEHSDVFLNQVGLEDVIPWYKDKLVMSCRTTRRSSGGAVTVAETEV